MKKKAITVLTALIVSLAPITAMAKGYTDVPAKHWASGSIQWGTDKGVVTGYPGGTFKPENSVTEEEFLTMLISAYEKRESLKGAATHWSDPFYYFANEKNYPTEGWDEPTARRWNINRQKVAEIVAGATGKNYSGDNAIKWLLAKGLAKGKSAGDVSVNGYKGADFLTRAEAVQFIKNAKENGLTELKVRPAQPSDPSAIPALPGQQQQPSNPTTQSGSKATTVTVVPSSNPDFLLPRDLATEPSVQSFLDSLRYDNGVVTGIVPGLPSGYVMTLTYTDSANKKNNKNYSKLKTDEPFSLSLGGSHGILAFTIYRGNEGKNDATIYVPTMTAEWGTKR